MGPFSGRQLLACVLGGCREDVEWLCAGLSAQLALAELALVLSGVLSVVAVYDLTVSVSSVQFCRPHFSTG